MPVNSILHGSLLATLWRVFLLFFDFSERDTARGLPFISIGTAEHFDVVPCTSLPVRAAFSSSLGNAQVS